TSTPDMSAPQHITTSTATALNGLTEAENALLRSTTLPTIGKAWLPMLDTISRLALENEISRLSRRYEQNVGFRDQLAQLVAREAYNLLVIAVGARARRFPHV